MSFSKYIAILQQLTPASIQKLTLGQVRINLGLAFLLTAAQRQQCQSQIAILKERLFKLRAEGQTSEFRPQQMIIKPSLPTANQPPSTKKTQEVVEHVIFKEKVGSLSLKPDKKYCQNKQHSGVWVQFDQQRQSLLSGNYEETITYNTYTTEQKKKFK